MVTADGKGDELTGQTVSLFTMLPDVAHARGGVVDSFLGSLFEVGLSRLTGLAPIMLQADYFSCFGQVGNPTVLAAKYCHISAVLFQRLGRNDFTSTAIPSNMGNQLLFRKAHLLFIFICLGI